MTAEEAMRPETTNGPLKWITAGYLVAAIGFVLLLAALARLIPLYDRFAQGPQGDLLLPISILFICLGGLLRHRERTKQSKKKTP
jgi:hypothetical protein